MALVFFSLVKAICFPFPFHPFSFVAVLPTLPSTRELFAQGFEVSFLGGGLSFFPFFFNL